MASFKNPKPQQDVPHVAGLSILVIEDNFLLARELEQALRDAGCAVQGPLATEPEALAFVEGHAHEVDGVLLDVNLQGVKATAVADELVGRDIPFIIVTGYEYDVLPPTLRKGDYVAKPISMADLLKKASHQFRRRGVDRSHMKARRQEHFPNHRGS
jgi:CheY-like chemotaxis protein